METLFNGFSLEVPEGVFPLSTDSMILHHFVRLPRNARVLDLGSGCGTLGTLLCAKDPGCWVTGLEIDPKAQEAAEDNIRRNQLSGRMQSICADLREYARDMTPGSYDICVSNPPYFSAGPASRQTPTARREDSCSAEDLCQAAGRALKYGGSFFLVHRPERLADLIVHAAHHGMEAKQLLLIRHHAASPLSIIALELKKGGKPGLQITEQTLFGEDNHPTAYYRQVYHLD